MTNVVRESETRTRDIAGVADLGTAPPPLRPGLVDRKRLTKRLVSAVDAEIISVIAPAGYGKSILLMQYAKGLRPTPAWLTLSRRDNDPTTLLGHLATSLHRADALAIEDVTALRYGVDATVSKGVSVLLDALAEPIERPILILDNAEVINRRVATDVLAELVRRTAGRIQIVIASRSAIPLPVPRMRTSGQLLELTEQDLVMTAAEARQLIANVGLSAEWSDAVIELCEGWPAALHLISLAFKEGDREWAPFEIGGDVSYMTDYLAEEVIKGLNRTQYGFMTRSSILDQLSAPLCDAVLETTRSDRMLRQIEEATHLVSAIDVRGDWFRTNRVFRDALQVELRRTEPEVITDLHSRAAVWYESQNMLEAAIYHARLARDHEQFARLLAVLIRTRYAAGRATAVLEWMAWLESAAPLHRYPDIAATGSLIHALEGDGLEAERWMEHAVKGTRKGRANPLVHLVKALAMRDGVEAMLDDSQTARASLETGSEWLPAVLLVEGLGHLWSGNQDTADPLLAEAVTLGENSQSDLTITVGLAERALISMGRGEWDRAEEFAQRALRRIDEHRLDGYSTSALALVTVARVARHRGDVSAAETMLARAAQTRPRLNSAIPGLAVQVAIEMAKAYVELSDVVGARALIRDAQDILLQRSDLGTLPEELERLKEALKNLGPGTIGPSALTKAELRLLPFLATHMTFPEIGDRLFISRHTVKTQAMSIYRKLGTSSRSEAVARALETGLLVP